MNLLKRLGTIVALGCLATVVLVGTSGAKPHSIWSYAQQCASNDRGPHNPQNPLDTPGLTGGNPLTNAHLFVESPWFFGGNAADAIAQEVGLGYLSHQWQGNPIPWDRFKQRVNSMRLSPGTAFRVHELEKIGDYPQTHQFSQYTGGGSGPAIYTQVQYYLCRMQLTDPGAAAEMTTYFLNHNGCGSGYQPNFQAEVQAFKAAVGNFRALIFIEEDALDTVCWRSPSAVTGRAALLKYEIDQLSTLPHALLYVEGGTSDADKPARVASLLNAADAYKLRGFFLNDTHFNWAAREIRYGNEVARRTHGLHFVVDTRGNGRGPILNRDPVTQGIEQLCNPPHRGLGPRPGASDGTAYGMHSNYLDGFVWVTTPGESTSSTCKGRVGHWAASGLFDEGLAIDFAAHANDRVGPSPRFANRPW